MLEKSDSPVRVRFAPSPTGYLHIGGARTALFNWMFARKRDGAFILRIEDTDRSRYVPDAEGDIKSSLRWLGLNWDEGPDVGGEVGPYRQSERSDLYRKWADWLVDHGYAYRCDCTSERLEEVRREQVERGEKPGYDRFCRNRNLGLDVEPHVVRFKMPLDGETVVRDIIRGEIAFQNNELNDLVLLKSDGLPTYHLANVVDDHFMQISHILRADEWIATAPLHARIYEAFGWQMPDIAHLPVILSPSGQGKLSKRDQQYSEDGEKIFIQVREFKEAGYLPEAVINFLTNVGWAFGDDREVFTPEEAIPRFNLEDINPAAAKLPYDKLDWLNGVYIREKMDADELATRLKPYLEQAGLEVDEQKLRQATPLIQERIKRLDEVTEWLGFLFRESITIDDPADLIQRKMEAQMTLRALRAARELLAELNEFDADTIEQQLRALADQLGLKAGPLFGTLRVATSGQRVAPPLFESLSILGRQACLERIEKAITLLEQSIIE